MEFPKDLFMTILSFRNLDSITIDLNTIINYKLKI